MPATMLQQSKFSSSNPWSRKQDMAKHDRAKRIELVQPSSNSPLLSPWKAGICYATHECFPD